VSKALKDRQLRCALWHNIDFFWSRPQISRVKYRVVIEPDEDGVFVAECPKMPGCISQGATMTEALANIKDAMTGYLVSLKKHGERPPPED
jgi:antitoxin HicB